ncbi:MAG: nitrilase-related carbon-nitrogen hydrolase [Phycisphaerales bacterium]|jgi:predicted amidohydrolase|nr:nitrilase-related carbon-nitrogen hydrolase [Phycisphaerales bacterium]
MRIHCVQFDIVWENKDANHLQIERLLDDSQPEAGDLIVLPEMADVGFSFALDRIVDERSEAWASSLAAQWRCWIVHGWPVLGADGRGRNVSGLIGPNGEVIGLAEKMHPFTLGISGSPYSPGDRVRVFDVAQTLLCPLTCYDLRFPEAFRVGMRMGAEVFTVIANWPQQRSDHWRALLQARAIENQAVVIGCNRTGSDPTFRYAGGSLIIDPQGIVLAEGGDQPTVLTAELDVDSLRAWRASFPALQDVREDLLGWRGAGHSG